MAQKKQESMVEHCGPQAESSPEVRNAEETTPENTECQEPFDNLELEDDMYNMAEHLENEMKQERLRRAEERRIEDDMKFLNTVIQVEKRAARKEKQAKLSALAN